MINSVTTAMIITVDIDIGGKEILQFHVLDEVFLVVAVRRLLVRVFDVTFVR